MANVNCNLVPTIGEDGRKSKVFNSILNFRTLLSHEDIKALDLTGISTIRDLASYVFAVSQTLAEENPSMIDSEGTGEIPVSSVLIAIKKNNKFTRSGKAVIDRMINEVTANPSLEYEDAIVYDGQYTGSQQNYINLVLGRSYVKVLQKYKNEASTGKISFKLAIVNQIKQDIEEAKTSRKSLPSSLKDQFVDSFFVELFKPDSTLWSSFLAYLNKTYGTKFKDSEVTLALEDEEIAIDNMEGVEDLWDPSAQEKVNRRNTVSFLVKQQLAEMLTDFEDVQSSNDFLYIQQPQDINTLWNRLIALHLYDITKEDMLDSLKSIENEFPSVSKIIEQFELTEGENPNENAINFVNAYISSIRLAVIPANILALDPTFNVDVYTNNKEAFPQDVITDRYVSIIESNLSNHLYRNNKLVELGKIAKELKDPKNPIYTNLKNDKTAERVYDQFIELFDYLGLNVTDTTLHRYINSQTTLPLTTFVSIASRLHYVYQRIYSNVNAINVDMSEQYNNIHELAAIESTDFNSPTNLSYLGVNGELRYSPQFDSFITKLLRGLTRKGKLNKTYLEYVFTPYLEDKRLNNPIASDNLLFYDEKTGIGMFERKTNVQEGEFPYKLNTTFVNDLLHDVQLKLSQFEGLKLRDTGFNYRDIQSSLYNFTELMYAIQGQHILLTSDSPRSYSVSTRSVKLNNLFKEDGSINREVPIFEALAKIVKSNIYDFNTAGSTIFNAKKTELSKYHNKKYSNGKEFLDKDGIPTGRAFKFLDITFNKNGKTYTFIDYVADQLNTSSKDVYNQLVKQLKRNLSGETLNLYNYVNGFIEEYINYNNQNVETWYGNIRYAFENIVKNNKLKSKVAERYGIDSSSTKFVHNMMLGAILNHTVYSVIFDNLVSGNITEYKDTTDLNKRSNAPIKNGSNSVEGDSNRRILLIEDGDFITNMLSLAFSEDSSDASKITDPSIIEAYKSLITYNDAQSIITDVALEKYLKSVGRWNDYKDIFADLRDPDKAFDPRKYNRLIESLKTFAYARRPRKEFHNENVDDYFGSQLESVQVKDSTLVIFPTTAMGSLKNLYDFMVDPKNDIDQISPVSAVKISGVTPTKLFGDNRELSLPKKVSTHTITLKNSDFVIQQDVKPAIVDEKIIIGNQFTKQLIQGLNMSENIYKINGKNMTGKEIFKLFQDTIYTNIEEDAMNLLYELGGLNENGTLNLDEQGNVTISYTKFIKLLQDVVEDDLSAYNIKEMIEIDSSGMPRLSLSYPVIYAKFENIILSKIAKKVLNQKLLGFHVPIVSDTFRIPLGTNELAHKIAEGVKKKENVDDLIEEYNAKINELVENGVITYSDDFIEKCKKEHRSLELRSEYGYDKDGNLINYAEVIANPFSLEFYNTIGYNKEVTFTDKNGNKQTKVFKAVDINDIPKEARQLVGIRIPTEGKQSMVLFEVVGFLNTGSSQAIFPAQLIKRTGWDFDIDSIYAYRRSIFFDGDNYKVEKFGDTDEAISGQNGHNFIDFVLAKKRRDTLVATSMDNPIKGAEEGSQIKGTLRSGNFTLIVNGLNRMFTSQDENVEKPLLNNIQYLQEYIANIKEYISNEDSDTFKPIKKYVERIYNKSFGALENNIESLKNSVTEYYSYKMELYNAKALAEKSLGRPLTEDEVFNLSSKIGNNYTKRNEDYEKEMLYKISNSISKLFTIVKSINSSIKKLEKVSTNVEITVKGKKGKPSKVSFKPYVESLKESIETVLNGEVNVTYKGEIKKANIFKVNNWAIGEANNLFDIIKENFKYPTDIYKRNSREARDNLIIDIAFAVLGNKAHAIQMNKPNESDHINACAVRDNRYYGVSFDTLNSHNMYDKMVLATTSMGSTVLKGHSVNFDNFVAIAGSLKAYSESGVKHLVNIDDLPEVKNAKGKTIKVLDSSGQLSKEYKAFLNKRLGEDNYEYQPYRKAILFTDKYFNNDDSGKNLDISGNDISLQQNETTTAILDSVKKPLMFMLNTDTLSVFRMLSSGTVIEKFYDPDNTSNRENNRFSYSSAFIQQPALVEVVRELNSMLILDDGYTMSKAIKAIKTKYFEELFTYLSPDQLLEVRGKRKNSKIDTSKKALDKVVSNLEGLYTVEYEFEAQTYYTTRELVSFMDHKNIKRVDFCISQLEILSAFEEYYKQAKTISNLTFALKTEGKIKGFNNLDSDEIKKADYFIDKSSFAELIVEKYDKSEDIIADYAKKNNIEGKEIRYDFEHMTALEFTTKYENMPNKNIITYKDAIDAKNRFNYTRTIEDRRLLLAQYNLEYESKFDIRVAGKSIIDAIFVSDKEYIDQETGLFKDLKNDSIYPIILGRYQFGRMFAVNGFNKTFAQRSLIIRNTVDSHLIKIGKSYDDVLRKKLTDRLVNYTIEADLEGQTPILQDVSRETLKIIIGATGEDHSAIIKKYTENIKDKLSDEDFKDYLKLSIAEQIYVITHNPTLRHYINKPDFRKANIFKYIQAIAAKGYNNKKGFDIIRIIRDDDTSLTTDSVISGIKYMWDSPNPFIAHTIRSLIAYTYITQSFTYGTNVSRYIPIQLITELSPNEIYDGYTRRLGYNDPVANISLYGTNLRVAEELLFNGTIGNLEEGMDFICRQMPEINRKLPGYAYQRKLYKDHPETATIGYMLNENKEDVSSWLFENDEGKTFKVIYETKNRLDNSEYANDKFLCGTYNNELVIYERFDLPDTVAVDPNDRMIVFIPTNKLLYNEFSEKSIVDSYNISTNVKTSDGSTISVLDCIPNSPSLSAFRVALANYQLENSEGGNIIYINDSEPEGGQNENLGGYNIDNENTIDKLADAYSENNSDEEVLHSINIDIHTTPVKTSLSESVKEIIEKSDQIIYIGEGKGLKYNLYKNSNKLIQVDYNNSPTKEAERIAKLINGKKIHIDGLSQNELQTGDNNTHIWVNMFISRLYELTNNIEGLSTLVTDGISKHVATSRLYKNTTNYVLDNGEQTLHSVNINIEDNNENALNSKLFNDSEIAVKALESVNRIINASKYKYIPNIDSIKDEYYKISNSATESSIIELLRRKDAETMDSVYVKLVRIYGSVLEAAKYILDDLKKTNVYGLEDDYIKYQKYKEKLNLAMQLISTISKFDSIRTINMEELGLDENSDEDRIIFDEQFATLNSTLKNIQEIYNNSREVNAELLTLADKVLVNNVIKFSRNPDYATAFAKVLKRVRETNLEELDNISFEGLNITDDERRDILIKVTDYVKGDITKWQLALDSAFVTGNTSVDVTGRSYMSSRYAAEKKLRSISDRVDAALEKINPDFIKDSGAKARTEYFKKFVDEYGQLIDMYDDAIIGEQLRALRNELYEAKQNLYDINTFVSTDLLKNVNDKLEDIIKSANERNVFTVEPLSQEEQNNAIDIMADMSDVERTAYLRKNNFVELYMVESLESGISLHLYKINYKDSAKNPKYVNLSAQDQEFLKTIKDMIQEILVDYNPNYEPYSNRLGNLFPYVKKATTKDILRKFVLVSHEREDKFYTDIDGSKVYVIEPTTIDVPRYYHNFEIPKRLAGENYKKYIERVLDSFKEFYSKDDKRIFKTDFNPTKLKDLYKYNMLVNLENKKRSIEDRSFDIKDVMRAFAADLYEAKIVKEYSTNYQLLKSSMVSHGADVSTPNLMQALENQLKRVANVSRVNSKLDVAASVVLRYTSMSFMYGNITAGIKNIMSGVTNMIIESTPNGMVTAKDVKNGIAQMIKTAPVWIANMKNERTDNLDVAILKDFDSIYQDTRDTMVSTSGIGFIAKALSSVDTIGYAPNNIGEWIMQFGMLFAATKSFRVVGNRAMSFNQFCNETKEEIARKIFTQEQRDAFYRWKEKKDAEINKHENKKNKKYLWNGDYIGEFMRYNKDMFTNEQIDQFIKSRRMNKEEERKRFEKFPTVYSVFEVKNGRLGFKEGYEIPDEYMTEFRETVKAINQSLHGIYNRVDRMALQDSMMGELLMQFRKWMRSTWNRYFGRRFLKTTFNETLGTYEVPIYKPIFDFFQYGIRRYKEENGNVPIKDYFKAFVQIGKWQLEAITRAKYFYNTLTIHEQAAFDKWVKHIATISITGVIVALLMALKPEDDEEESALYTLAMYEFSSYFKEIVEPVPLYGWYSTYQSVRDRIAVSEATLTNAYKVIYGITAGLFIDDEKMVYDRGIYKGQNKTWVAAKKLMPFIKEYNKWINMKSSMNLYNYYNPFVQ